MSRVSELKGEQQTALHAAAYAAGMRPDIHVGLDGTLLFKVAEQVLDDVDEAIDAYRAIGAAS